MEDKAKIVKGWEPCKHAVRCVDTEQRYCIKGDIFAPVSYEDCRECSKETPF
ncbi:MAG: hypothetical protein JEZ11_03960 [Desulfobacterales bacterium]|nr:hypothetical protein [Desulfobacterales bacterium]